MQKPGWAGLSREISVTGSSEFPKNQSLRKIHLPETCANLVFGGPLRNRLFVCGSTSVYALYVGTQGALKP